MRSIQATVAALVSGAACGVAGADIEGPSYNWSNWGSWGYCGVPTVGQSFVGNGETLSGVRYTMYNESSCCDSKPMRVSVYRWDPSSQRVIGQPIATRDETMWNTCCWYSREISLPGNALLIAGQHYIVVFTVSPWWNSYGCTNNNFSVNPDYYGGGSFYYLYSASDMQSLSTQSWSNVGYDLNFTIRTTNDCDANGIVDASELNAATDCDGTGILDACEQLAPATTVLASGPQGPVGSSAGTTIAFDDVRPSAGSVTLDITASGDLSATHEFLFVRFASGLERLLFTGAEQDCVPLSASITLTRAEFEAAIVDHRLTVSVSGSPTVDSAACGGQSWVSVSASYLDRWPDCNGNLVSDTQDFCASTSLDCNGNHRPDECDISLGASTDFDGDAQPDECQADCNGDGRPDLWQIKAGLLADCNGNAIPDTCDIASEPSADCNGNGIPDTCDIASGTSPDCDGDGRIDSCALAQQLVPDCNGNGVPDACDIASGTSADCNANGTPDSCDLSTVAVSIVTPQQAPFYNAYPLQYTINGARRTTSDVQLQIQYHGYSYAWNGQYFRPTIDGAEFGAWYDAYWGGCSSGTRSVTIPRDQWNAAASDGTILLRVNHDSGSNCGGSCQVTVTYAPEPVALDCNANAIPDTCDFASGFEHDCDANGIPDSCDIAAGAEDKNGNGYQDACELGRGDLNLDGVVDGADLGIMLSWWGATGYPTGDLNRDGVIDGVDLGTLLGNWGPID